MKTWEKLSALNVNNDKERKGRFDYLSWADAWKHVQNNTDQANYELHDDIVYPDGTREVRCSVSIDGVSHIMWLAVMDNQNRAIKNPDARAINDARMRCLVKAIAMHGLGLYIYAGEDLPDVSTRQEEIKQEFKDAMVGAFGVQAHEVQDDEPVDPSAYQAYWHDGTKAGGPEPDAEAYREKIIAIIRKYTNAGKSKKQVQALWDANFALIDTLGEANRSQIDNTFKLNMRVAKDT